jgi:hypothetical protein
VQTGRLYPDPLTAALFVWAAYLYAEGLHRSSVRLLAAASATFGAGLLLRAQVLEYFLAVIVTALLASAGAWGRTPRGRRLAAALVLGLLPAVAVWVGIRWAVGPRDDVIRMGQVTFRPSYPFGFWQQLDTDGWTGPYRFKQDPFYKEMEARARAGDPDLMRSRGPQLAFTARYVSARPRESLLLVLDNANRLYDRPANDYKWDYPYPYRAQVVYQRLLVLLGLAGIALFVAEKPALGGAFVVPFALALLHGLVFPWPRYNVPAMPIVIAAAGGLAARVAADRPWGRRSAWRSAILFAAAVALLWIVGRTAVAIAPEVARVSRVAGGLLLVVAPFAVAAAVARSTVPFRSALVAAPAAVALLFLAHTLRDRRWHETATRLGGDVAGVEQLIRLSPTALARLRAVPEAFVVFDLTVPRGDLHEATIEVGGRAGTGTELAPTMPRLRETTAAGGRDRRGYPQWWAYRLDPSSLPKTADEPLRVTLRVPSETDAVLRADRFSAQQRSYEGPSFGDWPHYAALKIEYDADYRIPVRVPLESVETESFVVRRSGERVPIRSVHRIRLVIPGSNEGSLSWETEPAPRAPAAFAFAAFSGTRGEAELAVFGAAVLRFPLGAREDFDREGGGWRLCQRAEPRDDRAYGTYVLIGPAPQAAAPLALTARYRAGLSQEPMFLVIDRKRAKGDFHEAARRCGAAELPLVDGAARLIDARHNNYPEDTGRWTVAAVY